MLFIESKTLRVPVKGPERLELMGKLQALDRTPLIRASRMNSFERLLLNAERAAAFESAVADWLGTKHSEIYLRGDLFGYSDHVLFLSFDPFGFEANSTIQAGIVYDSETPEPFRKLDAFCRDVQQSVRMDSETDRPDWQDGKPLIPEGFKRFVARQDNDSLFTSLRKDTMTSRILAASRLEDENARVFLRGAREAHDEGYAPKLLTGDTASAYGFSIERLEDVGLVEREVQVSCRKTGHAILRLPNANALVVVTVSDATCSECGAPVADEKVEEVIAPTRLASSLLEDGSWLVNRLHFLLREMGVPEREIAVGPSEGDGYGQMMANICGESFLLLARDGDVSPAFARWAVDLEIETEASHLVIVSTGRVHNQARLLLDNHYRRRVSSGRDFELIVADGPVTAGKELREAFERVSERVIAEQLCSLDASIGMSATRLVMMKFQFLRSAERVESQPVPREDNMATPPEQDEPTMALAAHAALNSQPVFGVANDTSYTDIEVLDPGEGQIVHQFPTFNDEMQL
jgi:hypothetical protein